MGRVWPHKRIDNRRDRDGGFTLVELLVVLVILGLVTSLVGPRVLGYLTDARSRTVELQINGFSAALDLFYLDVGRYPSRSEGLDVLVEQKTRIPGWNGPYLQQGKIPVDPWGKPYRYEEPGTDGRYKITSPGAEGYSTGGGDEAALAIN